MSYLLDTNVVSEWVKPEPARSVVAWLAEVDEDEVFLSVISIAALRRGIELLAAGRRRQVLQKWLSEDLADRFHGRVLSIDLLVAEAGPGRGPRLSLRPGPNTKDFEHLGVSLFNPWAGA